MTVASQADVTRPSSLPRSPYVGLVPYDEADAEFFFGRSTETAIVAANLRSARLTILYGPSGVGKSSLLMAGVVHGLREDARGAPSESPFAVCAYSSWREEPVRGLQEAAQAALQETARGAALPPPAATLAETLRDWTDRAGTLFLVLDQFEEYFQYHPDEGDDERLTGFAAELAKIVNNPSLSVNVLLSIREDAWAKLDEFEGHIPLLFANYLRVDHLDLDAAREAIEGPIEAWNLKLPDGSERHSVEPALTEAVLRAAAGGGLALPAGSQTPALNAVHADRVEAPFLQLVLDRLWRESTAVGEHTLTVARLNALGGARRIVENHLLDALGRLGPSEQDVASDCFRFLVSSGRTKISHPASDLAEWTKRTGPEVTAVLDKLCTRESGLILRRLTALSDEEVPPYYELFHDVLAEPILAWRRSHDQERDRRRLIRIGAVAFALVGAFAALSAYGLVQKGRAEHSARVANSEILASAARTHVNKKALSLLLALTANRIDTNVEARSAMMLALERSRALRVQAIRSGAVDSVAFSPDETAATLALGGSDGTVQLGNPTTGRPLGPPLNGTSFAFSPDTTAPILAIGRQDGTVQLRNPTTGRPLGPPLTRHGGQVLSVAFSRDGQTLASGYSDGAMQVWDVAGRRRLLALSTAHGAVNGIAFSPDGRTLATGSGDGSLGLWDVPSGTQLGPATQPLLDPTTTATGLPAFVPIDDVIFSPDGHTLWADYEGGTAQPFSIEDQKVGKVVRVPGATRSDAFPTSVAFSPDGHTGAFGMKDGTVQLRDVATGTQLGEAFPGRTADRSPDKSVQSVAFSPDGLTLVTGDDTGLRLWHGVFWSSFRNLFVQVCSLIHGQDLAPLAASKGVALPPGLTYRTSCPPPG